MTKWLLIDAMKVDHFKSFSNSEDISFGIGAMKKKLRFMIFSPPTLMVH